MTLSPRGFQSTPLTRGETFPGDTANDEIIVSIHSPHARGDRKIPLLAAQANGFNPLPSREGRPDADKAEVICVEFQSTPLTRGETMDICGGDLKMSGFNPLPSCEGRPPAQVEQTAAQDISIHSPHARGDLLSSPPASAGRYFNPLPSCEGRRDARDTRHMRTDDFNPLPSCEGRRAPEEGFTPVADISIHSPHARGDTPPDESRTATGHFNPLPSCEGRRHITPRLTAPAPFQSTPLMRGETVRGEMPAVRQRISIHSPHARGDTFASEIVLPSFISIHSPHARGDNRMHNLCSSLGISIHSPHARGDHVHGGTIASRGFQSTPLMRGETQRDVVKPHQALFQSTPLMRGETAISLPSRRTSSSFQSTPLMRGETNMALEKFLQQIFQSTPLMRGETRVFCLLYQTYINFNPLPSCEGRRKTRCISRLILYFNPLPSCEGRPYSCFPQIPASRFQSTPLMRGETRHIVKYRQREHISIHSPHARGDQQHTPIGTHR